MSNTNKAPKSGFMKKGVMIVGLRLAGAVLAYALVVLLARWLDADSYGYYSLIMSAITFGSVLSKLGADLSIVRFLGVYRAEEKPALAAGAVRTALISVLVLTLVIGLVAAGVLAVFPGIVGQPLAFALAALLIFPAFGLTDVLSGIIRSYGGAFLALAPKDVLWRIGLIAAAWAIAAMNVPHDQRLIWVIILSGVFLTGFTGIQFLAQKKLRLVKDGQVETPEFDRPAWKQSAVWTWSLASARTSFRTLDVITVGVILSPAAAGAYFAASRSAELLSFLLSAVNMIVGPAVARGTAKGDIKETQKKLSLVAALLASTVPVFGVVFVVWGREILGFVSPAFVEAYPAMLILAVGHAVNVLVGSAGVVLNMTGNERTNSLILMTSVPISLVLLPILGAQFGMTGVAIAMTTGLIVLNVRTYVATRRLTPYDPSVTGIRFLLGRK